MCAMRLIVLHMFCVLCWLCGAQVITSAEFHPKHCNIFAYSSSKGCIRLADMRNSALCDRHAKAYEEVDTTVSMALLGWGVTGAQCWRMQTGAYVRRLLLSIVWRMCAARVCMHGRRQAAARARKWYRISS